MQPTTVYMPALTNTLEATSFFGADLIKRALNKNSIKTPKQSILELFDVLVSEAIAREKVDHPNDAAYYVLLKALKIQALSPNLVSSTKIHNIIVHFLFWRF